MKNMAPASQTDLPRDRQKVILTLSILITLIEGLFILSTILAIPSEEESQVFLGLSNERLIIFWGLALILALIVFLAVSLVFSTKFTQKIVLAAAQHRYRLLKISCGLLVVFGWLSLVPGHDFEDFQAYYIRLKPIFIFTAVVSLNAIIYQIYYTYVEENTPLPQIIHKKKIVFSIIALVGLTLVWEIIRRTNLGITPHQPYWGEAGSPVFGYQVVLSLTIGGLVYWFTNAVYEKLSEKTRRGLLQKDLILFLLLWIAAASIWVSAPITRSFFLPTPVAPNMDYYPFSDAAEYDIFSQSILTGEGFWNKTFTYRPLYVFFLFLLHLAVGQDYLAMLNLQTVILALSVPCLYLLGKYLHSRLLGLVIAILGIFIEINSIHSTPFIQVTHSKLLLTEFPTGLLLIAATLFFIKWLDKHADKHLYITFGILGLSLLLRMHTITVIILFVCIVVFQYRKNIRKGLRVAGGLTLFIFLIITPWMMRNYLVAGSFSLDPGRLEYLIETRWQLESKTRYPPDSNLLQKPAQIAFAPDTLRENSVMIGKQISETPRLMVEHYLHNEILAALSLPLSYRFESIAAYYRQTFLFTKSWTGALEPNQTFFLITNLIILSVGIGAASVRKRVAGLIPLLVHLSYNISNALVRTSGWRYLKPTDWVIPLYFCVGLIELTIIVWVFISGKYPAIPSRQKSFSEPIPDVRRKTSILWGLLFIAISLMVSFLPVLIPRKYATQSSPQDLTTKVREIILKESSVPADQFDGFLSNPNTIATTGTAIYPRYYLPGEGIHHDSWYQFNRLEFPRLVFILINDQRTFVLLPLSNAPDIFPQGTEVIILGCKEAGRINALAVLVESGSEDIIYLRNPINNFQCPIPELSY